MAQKFIVRDNDKCRHMHWILRWLKNRTIYFSPRIIERDLNYDEIIILLIWMACHSQKL